MTFDDHISKAAGFFQLRMFQEAWSQLEEIDPEERAHPKVLGLRLGILKGLEKWEMGSTIARGAVKAFPQSTMLYVMGAIHIRHHENVQNALEFFSSGQSYLSGDGWFWYWLSGYQCQCGLVEDAKRSLAKAVIFDEDFRELAKDEKDLSPIWDQI